MTKVSEFRIRVRQDDGYKFETTFDQDGFAPLLTDEPPPLGEDSAPNPVRILAAAIGSCLSASLVFCMARREKVQVQGLETEVHVEIVRNEEKRLRVGAMHVTLRTPAGVEEQLEGCRELFEDFCTVTQSVRDGIPISVVVEPRD